MDFSIRRDPGLGIPFKTVLPVGPSVQMEIEHGCTAVNAVSLGMEEDGVFLRAVGPSLEHPTRVAIYTVTIDGWVPIIP